MNRLNVVGLVISLFLVSTPLIHSQSATVYHLPFLIDGQKLSYYLELQPFQQNEVVNINSFFIDQQTQLLESNRSPEQLQKSFERVLFVNLKLMKETLTEKQYRKYLYLINATNNYRIWAASLEANNSNLLVQAGLE